MAIKNLCIRIKDQHFKYRNFGNSVYWIEVINYDGQLVGMFHTRDGYFRPEGTRLLFALSKHQYELYYSSW